MQGSWQNPGLLIYDVAAQDWIRDEDDTIANFSNDADASIGGGLTFSPDGNLYITQPDWGGGGQDYVRVMDVAWMRLSCKRIMLVLVPLFLRSHK